MVRLKDIAQQAGVSIMTVSKALRDEHDVSASTKTRIKLLAQQLGYVPDSSAQGLRTRTTKLFGIAISSLANPVFSRIVLALEDRAHELGYDVLLAHSVNIPEREEACVRRFLSRRVDGLFIAPVYRMATQARIYQEIASRRVPTVLLGPPAAFCSQFVSIATEDILGSYAATQHLLKLGHKRIAFFAGPLAAPWSRERFEGYRRALREAGMEVDDKVVFQAGEGIEDGGKAALQMIQENCRVTAVQAVNDLVALGCAQVFLKQGLRIPEDISVVGFGNVILGEYFCVPLTTVRQPKFDAGLAAIELMQQLLQGRTPDPKRLPTELLIRASTGTVPATGPLHLKTDNIQSI